MSKAQCPVCDFALELPDLVMEVGISGVAVPTEDSLGKMRQTEIGLLQHADSHSTTEWIRAFRMADTYIDQLEDELEQAKEAFERPMAPFTTHPSQTADLVQWTDSEGQVLHRTPAQPTDPNQTMIPFIPTGQRPEGTVGRKS